jgi:hypothetical protein
LWKGERSGVIGSIGLLPAALLLGETLQRVGDVAHEGAEPFLRHLRVSRVAAQIGGVEVELARQVVGVEPEPRKELLGREGWPVDGDGRQVGGVEGSGALKSSSV